MTPNSPRQPFVVMAKPVGSRCNMRCSYCYYLDKGRFSTHPKQTRMSFTLLERLIRQTIEANPGPVVSFTWHGGEPTLAGLDFYEKALELERKYLPKGWQAWNSLQTNGLLLNDRWCRFLKEHRFDVGLSIDGSAAVHDANRRDLGGGPTFQRARQAAARLKAAGVLPDLLCTVNAQNLQDPEGVYQALRELGTGWVQFIPIVAFLPDGSLAPQSVTPQGYGTFLRRVFDLWVRQDLGKLDVQLFAEMARILAGGEPSLCWMSPTCGRVLVVEEDGGVYACDHFVDGEHRLGDLNRQRLEPLANSPRQLAFGSRKEEALTGECRSCPWYRFCGGGCPKDRFALSQEGEAGQYYLCPGLKEFFAHVVPVLEQVMALSREGLSPQAIMERVGQERPLKEQGSPSLG